MSFTIVAGGTAIDGPSAVYIDATTKVDVKYVNNVTKHPIESGSAISDHVYSKNTLITITGVIVNYPMREAVDRGRNRVPQQYRRLVSLKEGKRTVSVNWELSTLTDCVITQLDFPRTAEDGDALPFRIQLEQVQFVSSQQAAVSGNLRDKLASTVSNGNSNGKNPADKDSDLKRFHLVKMITGTAETIYENTFLKDIGVWAGLDTSGEEENNTTGGNGGT